LSTASGNAVSAGGSDPYKIQEKPVEISLHFIMMKATFALNVKWLAI